MTRMFIVDLKFFFFWLKKELEFKRFYNRIFIFINVPVNSTDPCSIEKGNLVDKLSIQSYNGFILIYT